MSRPPQLLKGTSKIGLFEVLDSVESSVPGALHHSAKLEHHVSLGGAPTDVHSVSVQDGGRVAVRTSVLGVVGDEALLPESTTESVLSDDVSAIGELFDLFHARGLEVLHDVWRTCGPHGATHRWLRSFVGELTDEASSDPWAHGLSDILRCAPEYLDPNALEELLARAFPGLGARVSIAPPEFVALDDDDRTALGEANFELSASVAYATGPFDPLARFRITTRELRDIADMLPGGQTHTELCAFVEKWLPRTPNVELEVPMPAALADLAVLGGERGASLGYDVQLFDVPPERVRVRITLRSVDGEATVGIAADE